MVGPEQAVRALAERAVEKEALVEALDRSRGAERAAGRSTRRWTTRWRRRCTPGSPQAGSALASVQVDDLAGETVATNLPGTDKERPNWRHRLQAGRGPAVRCAARARDPRRDARRAAEAGVTRLSIEALSERFPEFRVAVVIAEGLTIGERDEALDAEIAAGRSAGARALGGRGTFAIPGVAAWRTRLSRVRRSRRPAIAPRWSGC